MTRPSRVVLDFETFYDPKDGYTLAKMTPWEYITDPRFEALLCVLQHDDGVETLVGQDAIAARFAEIDWSRAEVVAHNGNAFDFLIMAWKFGVRPHRWFDTLVGWRRVGRGPHNLAQVARDLNVAAKGDEVQNAAGKRLGDFASWELEAYIDYCKRDVGICAAARTRLLGRLTNDQVAWMDLCARMACEPRLKLDPSIVEQGMTEETERQEGLVYALARMLAARGVKLPADCWAGRLKCDPPVSLEEAVVKAVRSPLHAATVLEAAGVEAPLKDSPATGLPVPALAANDRPFKYWAEGEDDFKAAFAQCRLATKSTINLSRLARFKELGSRFPEAMPVFINALWARTGRNSGGSGLNLQNLSARPSFNNPKGKRNALRRAIKAPPGYVVLAADSSQLEVRVAGALAGERAILDVFSDPSADPYCAFASDYLYHRPIVKGVDKRERNVAKSAVLGNGFGQGPAGFKTYCAASGVEIDDDEAARVVQAYRDAHPRIVELWHECSRVLDAMMLKQVMNFGANGCLRADGSVVYLPDGTEMHYHDLKVAWREDMAKNALCFRDGTIRGGEDAKRVWIHGSSLMQNCVQGTAAAVIHWQAVQIAQRFKLRPVLQVHDELVYVVEAERAEKLLARVTEVMSEPPPWLADAPLAAEGGYGESYADV